MMLCITPFDTVLFGVGKTLVRGEDVYANGVFPPYPSVFFGALRSLFFSLNIDKLQHANTKSDETLGFKIEFYSLMLGNGIFYFPLPSDLAVYEKVKKSERNRLCRPLLEKNDGLSTSNLLYRLVFDLEAIFPEAAVIRNSNLQHYLENKDDEIYKVDISELICEEPRTGIYRDRYSRTTGHGAGKGMLYKASMLRTDTRNNGKLSFAVKITTPGIALPETGKLRIGSHGKAAKYETIQDSNVQLGAKPESARFKLYFATPAIFENGWIPKGFCVEEDGSVCGSLAGIKVRIIAASIRGYVNCGGYDIKNNRPKPMKRCLPAGSVYYMELTDDNEQNRLNLFDVLNGKMISDERAEEGFGLVFVGRVNNHG